MYRPLCMATLSVSLTLSVRKEPLSRYRSSNGIFYRKNGTSAWFPRPRLFPLRRPLFIPKLLKLTLSQNINFAVLIDRIGAAPVMTPQNYSKTILLSPLLEGLLSGPLRLSRFLQSISEPFPMPILFFRVLRPVPRYMDP